MQNPHHYLIVMAGGVGSRFWPMSRTQYPKQFHDILGKGKTLIQETIERFSGSIPKENIYIVTNKKYKEKVKEQLGDSISTHQILLEPVGRNTAPCVAYACYKIRQKDPLAVCVVAAADHIIENTTAFIDNIHIALDACTTSSIIMTLGITPTAPVTGYGYIQRTDTSPFPYFKVKTFAEKPTQALAEQFLESGDFVWNSGIFVFSVQTIIHAFEQYLVKMAEAFQEIEEYYYTEKEWELIEKIYISCQNISIDVGIMERAQNIFVLPTDCGWSDLGTWGSVYEKSPKTEEGNALLSQAILYDARNNLVQSANPDKIIVMKGLEDYIIVDTEDALLIYPKKEEQDIKNIVEQVKKEKGEKYI